MVTDFWLVTAGALWPSVSTVSSSASVAMTSTRQVGCNSRGYQRKAEPMAKVVVARGANMAGPGAPCAVCHSLHTHTHPLHTPTAPPRSERDEEMEQPEERLTNKHVWEVTRWKKRDFLFVGFLKSLSRWRRRHAARFPGHSPAPSRQESERLTPYALLSTTPSPTDRSPHRGSFEGPTAESTVHPPA